MQPSRGLVTTSAGTQHYRLAPGGDGLPVLTMHINQRSSVFHQRLIGELAGERTAASLDHPSHGMSDRVPGSPAIADYASWALEVADGLGWERMCVLGEAVSALVGVELAIAAPDRVERLVLVNCPSWAAQGSRTGDLQGIRAQRPADSSGWPLTRTIDFVLEHDPEHAPLHPTQEWMDEINLAQMQVGRDRWKIVDAMEAYDLGSRLGLVPCPVLAVWGEHFLYAANQGEFTERLSSVTHVTIPDGRFDLCWEHPVSVATAVGSFLDP